MALINFATPIRDLSGKPIREDAAKPDSPVFTLRSASATALTNQFADETTLKAEEKLRRFQLAMKVMGGDVVDLKAEEIALLKDLIGRSYGTLVVGRAFEILDPPAG